MAWLGIVFCPVSARADHKDSFEGAETAWRLADADCDVKTLMLERTWKEAHAGHSSEHWRLAIAAGNKVHLAYDTPRARVIAELRPTLWVKADRVGTQLLGRVVLPRTRDPRTGRPLTILLPGTTYAKAGAWEQLEIKDPRREVDRQARVLRAQFGPDIDMREAYLDKLVLNVYSEPGILNLWLDDLEVAGLVRADEATPGVRPAGHEQLPPNAAETPSTPAAQVELDGSQLLVAGRPLAVRMIEHQGESLAWLQSLGFNAVLLRQPATHAQLAEAQRSGLWLVAPPPLDPSTRRIASIGAEYGPILAWHLGQGLGWEQLDSVRSLTRDLRSADAILGRPTLAGADAALAAYSRSAGALLLEPPALAGSLELSASGDWLAQRPRLARPGTPWWVALATEPPPTVMAQVRHLRGDGATRPGFSYQQLRLLALTAAASGARGICFRSQTRLDAQERTAQQRTDILKLINAELRLVEPWMAVGDASGEVEVDDPAVRVRSLQTPRARLLIVTRYAPGQQFVMGRPLRDKVTLVIPGTPSSMHVYRVSTHGMAPLTHKRVTGGTQIALDSAAVAALVLLTQDPLVVGRVMKDLSALEAQHARLHYDVTMRAWEQTQTLAQRLPLNAYPGTIRELNQASTSLQQGLRLLASGDRRGAQTAIAEAEGRLAAVEQGHFLAATQAFASPVESPLCTNFATLADHYELAERLRTATWVDAALPGGDMERLETLIDSGWKHQRDKEAPWETLVELAPAPHSGSTSLHLAAHVRAGETSPAVVETPPLWVTARPLLNASGGKKLARVRGFVRTSAKIEGSPDGLFIFDSQGSPALGLRMLAPDAWRPFTLYRAVGPGEGLTVTFALTGLGEAWLDDIAVEWLDLP